MDSLLKQPAPMSMSGDLSINWKKFNEQFEIYMLASNGDALPAPRKAALLLHIIGYEALEIYRSFQLTNEEKQDPEVIKQKFEAYFVPKTNVSIERHKFHTKVQAQGESFDAFHAELVKMASLCEFGNLKDDLIKDRIICGVIDVRVKNRLLREEDLTLTKTIKICKAAEECNKNITTLQPNVEVQAMTSHHQKKTTTQNKNKNYNNSGTVSYNSAVSRKPVNKVEYNHYQRNKNKNKCGRCGYNHPHGKCSAFGALCGKCNKYNHFTKMCRVRELHNVENTENNIVSEQLVLTVNSNVDNIVKDWYATLFIENCNRYVKFKIDSGAQVNVLPEYMYYDMKCDEKIKPYMGQITSYGGTQLQVVGCCNLNISVNKQRCNLEFIVIKTNNRSLPILGLKDSEKLNLISKSNEVFEIHNNFNQLIKDNEHLFSGIGKINNIKCNFKLKPDYEPVTIPARRIPFSLRSEVKAELERLCKQNIICEVKEPTEFVSPLLVLAKPNKKLRLVLDPHHLNEALYRELYQLPTFEEITSTMVGSKIFSTLDANKGFWQIELSEEASKLTTFSTPFGRFRFCRLPFGLRNAPEIFHRVFSEIFAGIPGVKIYIDDIIIYAKSIEEHNEILSNVLNKANEAGVRFNKAKCKFLVNEIKYVGHILSESGIRPDSDKVIAIKSIQEPKNTKELLRFLGTVNYLGKFIPNLADLTFNLRKLIKKDTVWLWTDVHQKEFENLKNMLSSDTVLAFFDEKADNVLSVDSSKHGLGAVLLQKGKPIAYASKALSEAQQQYSQLEKEALAISFGCNRFHQYLFGKHFLVESDHKPLENIFKKPLDKCPFRLKHLKAALNQYSFTVKYKPGAKLFVADNLSRDSLDTSNFKFVENFIDMQVDLLEFVDVSEHTQNLIKKETLVDEELIALKRQIINGWPNSKNEVNNIVKPYWKIRNELSAVDNFVLKSDQFVIPKSLRQEIIDRLHYNHLGIQKTIAKAKELVFWPCITNEIQEKIKNCPSCILNSNNNAKENIILNKNQNLRPWQEIAADIFSFKGKNYLLVVDKYSKYPEVCCLQNDSRHENFIDIFKSILARHGKPDTIFSDNGPQFNNQFFKNFLKEWEIQHITSSPRYPQSNGFIERHIQTIKNLFKKAIHSNKDIYLCLLEYRNTPIDSCTPSPAQMLFGRRLKGHVPVTKKLLVPKIVTKPDNTETLRKTEYYYNKNAKNLPELKVGDRVIVSNIDNSNKWEPGTIIKCDNFRPRSYHIKLDKNAKIFVRNRRFIKKCNLPCNYDELFETELEDLINDYKETHENISVSNSSPTVSNDNNKNCINSPVRKIPQQTNISVRRSAREKRLPKRFDDYQM